MRRTLLPLPFIAALALAAAGCGSNDNGGSTSTAQAASTQAGGASGGGKVVTVDMRNIQFVPKSVTAHVGQTIRWANQDTVDHNVVADSGASFKSDNFGRGGTFQFKAAKPGTIQYECTLHPGMTGTIEVR